MRNKVFLFLKQQGLFSARVLMLLLVFLIGIQAVVLYTFDVPLAQSKSQKETTEDMALRIFGSCKNAKYRPHCYDIEIPKLMEKISMEEAFAVTKVVQDLDSSYTYCHVLGHKLSAQEVAKDPSKWKDVVTRCPSGVCSNGCLHGGFQEKFRKQTFTDADIEKYKPDISGICEARGDWKPTGVEQASCYHAVGHLTMYITNGDIRKSLDLCVDIAKKPGGRDYTMLCYDGAFMQIFQPLEPDDIVLVEHIKQTRESVFPFCGTFSLAEQASCVNESWPLFRDDIMTPEGFIEHCSKSPTQKGKEYCYTALSYIVTPKLQFDPKKAADFCGALPEIAGQICFENAATRMIETDTRNISRAVDLCGIAPKGVVQDACYNELAIRAGYYLGNNPDAKNELCDSLPPSWKNICTASK